MAQSTHKIWFLNYPTWKQLRRELRSRNEKRCSKTTSGSVDARSGPTRNSITCYVDNQKHEFAWHKTVEIDQNHFYLLRTSSSRKLAAPPQNLRIWQHWRLTHPWSHPSRVGVRLGWMPGNHLCYDYPGGVGWGYPHSKRNGFKVQKFGFRKIWILFWTKNVF